MILLFVSPFMGFWGFLSPPLVPGSLDMSRWTTDLSFEESSRLKPASSLPHPALFGWSLFVPGRAVWGWPQADVFAVTTSERAAQWPCSSSLLILSKGSCQTLSASLDCLAVKPSHHLFNYLRHDISPVCTENTFQSCQTGSLETCYPLKGLRWGERHASIRVSEDSFPQQHFPYDVFTVSPHSDLFHWSMICWEESRVTEPVHREVVWLSAYPLTPPVVFAVFSTDTSISEIERVAFKNSNNL